MKNIFHLIFYLLILSIIGAAAFFLIFNQNVNNYLESSSNLKVVLPAPVKIIPKKDSIDSEVLKNPRLKTLVNNVVNFNFSNICWRPTLIISTPLSSENTASSSTSSTATFTPKQNNCRLGNGLPFLTKTK